MGEVQSALTSFLGDLNGVALQAVLAHGGRGPPADGDGGVVDILNAQLQGLASGL